MYNSGGPYVYGASALPYVAVVACLRALGLGMDQAALAVNIIGLGGVLWLLYDLLGSDDRSGIPAFSPIVALIPCVITLYQGTTFIWVTQGLESGFQLLLCVAAIWCFQRRHERWSGVFLGFALVDKLDAATLALAIGIVAVVRSRRPPMRLIAAAALTYLPWLLFTTLYFGSPIPMSLQAKLLGDYSIAGHRFAQRYLGIGAVVAAGLTAPFLLRRRFVAVMATWFVVYVVAYDLITKNADAPWYFFPSDFVIYGLAGITTGIPGHPWNRYLQRGDRSQATPSSGLCVHRPDWFDFG